MPTRPPFSGNALVLRGVRGTGQGPGRCAVCHKT
jgi:hypothetical protein